MEHLNDIMSTSNNFLNILEINGDECRLCLTKSEEMWGLFQCHDTPQKIMACTAIQVAEGDGLPSVICCTCRRLLDLSYGFKCQVEKCDARLRQVLEYKPPMSSYNPLSLIQNVEEIKENVVTLNPEGISKNETIEIIHQFNEQQSVLFQLSSENQQNREIIKLSSISSSNSNVIMEEFILPSQNDSTQKNSNEMPNDNFFTDNSNVYTEVIFNEDLSAISKSTDQDKNEETDPNNLILKCLHCDETFRSKFELEKHSSVHEDEKFSCYMCDMKFTKLTNLKNHFLNMHNSLKIKETNLNKEEDNQNDDQENQDNEENGDLKLDVNSEKRFICEYCTTGFTDETACLNHVKKHINEKSNHIDQIVDKNHSPKGIDELETDVFEGAIVSENSNESEEANAEDDMFSNNFQCTQCGKLFATKRNLNRHMMTHSGLKFGCPKCNKEFSRADKLKEHEKLKHSDIKQNSIDIPDDEDEEVVNDDHEDNDHDDDEEQDNDVDTDNENKNKAKEKMKNNRPHQCSLCPKAFAQLQSLENHLERHQRIKDNYKRYLCEICSKSFAQGGSLVAHMRTHTGVKPYICNTCNRAFTKSTYLQLHLRTHSGEKPYVCQYCNRAFARANTLARHITMHTGEAKYHCQICRKSFRRLTSLKEHTYTHTGQRPYACKLCSKRYNNAGSLYAHTKKCKTQQLTSKNEFNEFNQIQSNEINNDIVVTPMVIYTQKTLDNNQGQSFIVNNIQNQKQLINNPQEFTLQEPDKNSYQQMFFPPV